MKNARAAADTPQLIQTNGRHPSFPEIKTTNYSRTLNPRDEHLPLTLNGENLEVAPFAGQPPPPGTWRGRAAGHCVATVAAIPQGSAPARSGAGRRRGLSPPPRLRSRNLGAR